MECCLLLELVIHFTEGSPLNKVDTFKYLGLWIDSEFSFRPLTDFIIYKINVCLRIRYWSMNCFNLSLFPVVMISYMRTPFPLSNPNPVPLQF